MLDNNKQTKAAKTVKFVDLIGGFPKNSVQDRHEPAQVQDNFQPININDLGPNQEELLIFNNKQADKKF